MKRFFITGMLLTVLFTGTAYAAERETMLLVDGIEKELQHPLWQIEERVMISVDDFVDIVNGELKDGGGGHIHLKVGKQEGNDIWLDEGYEFWIAKNQKDCWTGMLQAERGSDDVWYIPLRDAAERVDWTVSWKIEKGEKNIHLQSPVMPRLTMTAEYDRKKNSVSAFLQNDERQAFTGYYDIFLQKRTEKSGKECHRKKKSIQMSRIWL